MRKLLFIIMIFPMLVLGQATEQNYVKTTIYRDSQEGNPIHSITYFDGLGRPIQKIASKQSNSGKDIVIHIEYDALGRQAKEYLPFASAQENMDYIDGGSLQPAIISQYQTLYGDSNPFSEKQFETSPLNRVLKQAAPGNNWAMGQGHEVQFDYKTNETNEVHLFKVNNTWNDEDKLYSIVFVDDNYYEPNQLYKTITKDENWISGNNHTTEEFKDKEGHVVLKRTYNNESPIDTYYVYDDYGNLTYVLPPLVDANGVTQAVLNDLCYQYKYDHRNRLVEKKLPGKQWEYIAYNSQDKPFATGPALNPFGGTEVGWLITKYDIFGRVVYTGWQQSLVESKYRVQLQYNLSNANWAEHFISSPSTIDNFSVNYSNDTQPTGLKLLTVNYYDSYTYNGAPTTIPANIEGQPVLTNFKGMATGNWVRVLNAVQQYGELSYTLYDQKARPIVNHHANYLGGFTDMVTSLDFSGKTIYTITEHKREMSSELLKVKDSYEYTTQDRLVEHTQSINGSPDETIVQNSYDELGQLIGKDVGGTGDALQKVNYSYNIRGWLKTINDISNLENGTDPTDLFAFKINYNDPDESDATALYNGNICQTSWRTSTDNVLRRYKYDYDNLNRLSSAVYQKPENVVITTNMYNESMSYDKNGNIQSLQRNGDWDSYATNSNQIDGLTYVYDIDKKNQLMRVTDATNSPKGFKDETADNPDNNTDGTVNDYSYDDYGNMRTDDNKNIVKMYYNHLNLPTQINFGTGDKIEYLYDAIGQKKRKVVTHGTDVTTTDYIDGFQYTDATLTFFPHAEGYVNVTYCDECVSGHQQLFSYVYQYKDHLGNIRVSYGYDEKDEVLKIIEENHYYPFGLKHTRYNSTEKIYVIDEEEPGKTKMKQVTPLDVFVPNNYKYNGKEYQDELGLNMYAMDMRQYDPAIGRWVVQDPIVHHSMSPYNGFDNNPVVYADPSGSEAGIVVQDFNGNWHNVAPSDFTVMYQASDGSSSNSQVGSAACGFTEPGEDPNQSGDDCPSCKTQEDWNNYYQQGENTESMVGSQRITLGRDEDGHTLYYLDGELMDLRRYNNWFHAAGSFLSDGIMPEVPTKLFKFFGNIFKTGEIKTAEEVFNLAKAGGRHSGFYKNYVGRSSEEIYKAMNSLQAGKRGINTHLDKIVNPIKYVPNWNSLSPIHQLSLLNGWKREINNAREQIQILRGILGSN